MDRFGSALGAALRKPVAPSAPSLYAPPTYAPQVLGQRLARTAIPAATDLGGRLAARTPAVNSFGSGLGTRMPSLFESATQRFGSGLAGDASGYLSSFFDKNQPRVALPGSSIRDALSGFGGSFGQQVGAAFSPTGAGFASGRLDDAAGEINAAAAKYGLPANFLATIIAKESSGDWNRWSQTAWHRGQPIYGYIGVYEDAARTRGLGDLWDRAAGNRALQIELLAGVLRSQYDQLQQKYPGQINWLNVASYHYSGNPFGGAAPADSTQHGSSDFYMNDTARLWGILEPGFNPNAAGSLGGQLGNSLSGGSGWGGSGNITTMLGGSQPRITQEFGLTDFARGHLNGMYSYATAYGGQGHVGLDIGLNPGSPLYAPIGGTVITTGGTGYYTDSRYDKYAPGRGELKIKLDNGDEVILGHMQSIGVQVGQRVSAGQLVGLSGTNNGGHVHLEYRKYTPGATSSGYTAIDPRTALGGSFGGGFGGGFGQPVAPLGNNISDASRLVWDQSFRNQYR